MSMSVKTSNPVTITCGPGAGQANADAVRNRGASLQVPAARERTSSFMDRFRRKSTVKPEEQLKPETPPKVTFKAEASKMTSRQDQINLTAYARLHASDDTNPRNIFFSAFATVKSAFSAATTLEDKEQLGADLLSDFEVVLESEKNNEKMSEKREALLKDTLTDVVNKETWGEDHTPSAFVSKDDRKSSERAG